MSRAPFQVLVLPFRHRADGSIEYAIFRRADLGVWQGLAGGGENDESPMEAAVREAGEEAGIPASAAFIRLSSVGAIPVDDFAARALWDPELLTIPEYSFGVEVFASLTLSPEHSEMAWLSADTALARLEWESNRAALMELDEHLGSQPA